MRWTKLENYVSVFFSNPMHVNIREKSFFSSESGATKNGLGSCAEELNAITAKTGIFRQNGWPRSLICISNDFDPLCWSKSTVQGPYYEFKMIWTHFNRKIDIPFFTSIDFRACGKPIRTVDLHFGSKNG